MTELPLFPLRSVLCPGIALPLHIFEQRYRTLIGRCLESSAPFGVVLLREGSEVGPIRGDLARVGTTASIRQAERHRDGTFDIVTVGVRRFRLEAIERDREPWLVGHATLLDEPVGSSDEDAEQRALRVGARFLRYQELLRPALDATAMDREPTAGETAAGAGRHDAAIRSRALDDRQRGELLMASARRLVLSGDATAVSYLLTGLIQVDLATRQRLLEAPDTSARLARIEALLAREIRLLGHDLRPLSVDPNELALRRN
jgi:Lon protease-like protein